MMMNKLVLLIFLAGSALQFPVQAQQPQVAQTKAKNEFSFVFMTDVHIKDDPFVLTSFRRAIDSINALKPDFVLSGGDQVFDVMRGNVAKSDSLFELFASESKRIKAPLYTTLGNHELFGIYKESPTDHTHPDYKYGMYERHFGPTYYSFDHEGWHFIVLNNLDVDTREQRFFAGIDQAQLDWLEQDLEHSGSGTPVVMMMHIPIVSVQDQYDIPTNELNAEPPLVNKDKLMALIRRFNVRLVLQGHLHFWEDMLILGQTRFITGGAIAGRPSWRGTNNGPRGFLHFQIKGDQIDYRFVAYDQED